MAACASPQANFGQFYCVHWRWSQFFLLLNFSCGTPSREHEIARPPLVAAHGSPILGCPIVSTQDDIFTWHPLKLSDRQTLLTSLMAYAWQFGSCLSGDQTKTCFLLSVTIHLDSVFCVFYSDQCVLNFSQVLSSVSSILYLIFCILYSVFQILYFIFCILNFVFLILYFVFSILTCDRQSFTCIFCILDSIFCILYFVFWILYSVF